MSEVKQWLMSIGIPIPGIFDSQILTISSRRRSRLHILVAKKFASRGEASTGP